MRILLSIMVAAFALRVDLAPIEAARDSATQPRVGPPAELIVVEVENCIYCSVFRRDILPAYMASPRAKDAPIRFVDYNASAVAELRLETPVRIVPTFILVKENREVGRIAGHVGRSEFFQAVTRMLYAP